MLDFTKNDLNHIRLCVKHFERYYTSELMNVVISQLQLPNDDNVVTLFDKIIKTNRKIGSNISGYDSGLFQELTDENISIMATAIKQKIRDLSINIEERINKTANPDAQETIQQEIEPYKELLKNEKIASAKEFDIPQLSDYLNIETLEKTLSSSLPERIYDDKFHILQSQGNYIGDLKYFRDVCCFRKNSICVGYIDIDDFKEFNTKYTQAVVDRIILPIFMNALESIVHLRGFAYRHGGDEYVVTLPNMKLDEGEHFFINFQNTLEALSYPCITDGVIPSVSIGLVEITSECMLTEREILERVCKLENDAKQSKGCINKDILLV